MTTEKGLMERTRVLWTASLLVGLLGATLETAPSDAATTVVHEDFEDGQYEGTATRMAVPPQILEENGNKFLRITGSASDRDHLAYCKGKCPNRNRSVVILTKEAPHASLPERWTYQFDVRARDLHPKVLEANLINVTVNTSEGYCGNRLHVFGPQSAYTSKQPGRYYFDRRLKPSAGSFNVELGVYDSAQWHTVRMDAVFAKPPDPGHLTVSIDGKALKTFTGQVHPTCGWLTPQVSVGLYGDYATGIADFDNIHVDRTGTEVVIDPTALPRLQAWWRSARPADKRVIADWIHEQRAADPDLRP